MDGREGGAHELWSIRGTSAAALHNSTRPALTGSRVPFAARRKMAAALPLPSPAAAGPEEGTQSFPTRTGTLLPSAG